MAKQRVVSETFPKFMSEIMSEIMDSTIVSAVVSTTSFAVICVISFLSHFSSDRCHFRANVVWYLMGNVRVMRHGMGLVLHWVGCVEHYRWLMIDDSRTMDNDIWAMNDDGWSVNHDVWSVENQRWTMVDLWSLVINQIRPFHHNMVFLFSLTRFLCLLLPLFGLDFPLCSNFCTIAKSTLVSEAFTSKAFASDPLVSDAFMSESAKCAETTESAETTCNMTSFEATESFVSDYFTVISFRMLTVGVIATLAGRSSHVGHIRASVVGYLTVNVRVMRHSLWLVHNGVRRVEDNWGLVVHNCRTMHDDRGSVDDVGWTMDDNVWLVEDQRWSVVDFWSLMIDQVRSFYDHVVLLRSSFFFLYRP